MEYEQIVEHLNNESRENKISFMDYEFFPIEENINKEHKYFIKKYELKYLMYFRRPIELLKT